MLVVFAYRRSVAWAASSLFWLLHLLLTQVYCIDAPAQAGVGVLAPIAALEANPLPNAVAVVSLEDAAKTEGQVSLPAGAVRLAVSIKVRSLLLVIDT